MAELPCLATYSSRASVKTLLRGTARCLAKRSAASKTGSGTEIATFILGWYHRGMTAATVMPNASFQQRASFCVSAGKLLFGPAPFTVSRSYGISRAGLLSSWRGLLACSEDSELQKTIGSCRCVS